MKCSYNYHTHSHYCDGKGTLEDYIQEAIKAGLTDLGFSGHAPLPFDNSFSIKDDQYLNYCHEVNRLKEKYSGVINIHLGLEIDYIPSVHDDFRPLVEKGNLDYFIGSVHLINRDHGNDLWMIDGSKIERYDEGFRRLFGVDIKAGVKAFYEQTNEMILSQKPPIIGHFNKVEMNNKNRYFLPTDKWYQDFVNETLDIIQKSGCICEINTRGIYKMRYWDYYPSKSILKLMKERRIPVMAASDAHHPSEVAFLLDEVHEYLNEIGYPKELIGFN